MPKQLQIDFVSDVACPWCVIGLRSLEEALVRASDEVTADIRLQPFELNPQMAPEGQDMGEHLAQKYETTPAQSAANRQMIRSRAAELGFAMRIAEGDRVYNTFDAHRLLHWAGVEGRQVELKHALFEMYFSHNRNTADREVLLDAAAIAGLDRGKASDILSSGRFADDVRADEALWQSRGISSVPAVVIDGKYLISGGQPVESFEQALRTIARESA